MRSPWNFLLAIALVGVFAACEDPSFSDDDIDTTSTSDDSDSDDTPSDDTPSDDTPSDDTPSDDTPSDDGIVLSSVTWLDTDVSSWKQTSKLSVSISGGYITLDYDKATVWPALSIFGATVNANPWVFVKIGGKWNAATFEWLRRGQIRKPTYTVDGSHINVSPLSSWHPKSGETYGFMVSGLARTSTRNVKERTQIVMVKWP